MEEDKSWCARGKRRHSGEVQSDSIGTSVCLETVRLTNCFSVVGAFTKGKARLRGTESAKATRDRVLV